MPRRRPLRPPVVTSPNDDDVMPGSRERRISGE